MTEVKRPPQQQTLPERKHGILYNLLWGWPWALAGVVLSSLLLSLLIEYIGIADTEGSGRGLRKDYI